MPASTTGRPAAVLSILVTANTRAAQANLAALDRQLAYSVKRAGLGATALSRAATGLRFAGVGAAAGIAGAVGAAVSFEQSFANVKKTVQASEPVFKRVRTGILDLSEHVPESANSLAELAGEAGALGVKAKQLVGFTRTASQLGTATTLSSEMAADSLARLGNIMEQRTNKDFRRMGSVLVDLGNKGASTESEIAAMSLRIAGAGRQVGLTSAQVLGLGAALANVGIRAEMGGSAISRVMLAMDSAIAKGGAELQLWAETAGMSVGQFEKLFSQNAPAAIAAFADGLNKIHESGGDLAGTLSDLGKAAHTSMNEIRVRDTLLRIAGNTKQFSEAQGVANKEWEQNNALTTEAHKRYQTLASQITLLKNEMVRFGIDLGTDLMPNIRDMVEILRDPKLTLGEKAEKLVDELMDLFRDAVPVIASIGGHLGAGLISGIADAWWHSDMWGKLFETAVIIRLIGGPGALRAVGMALGTGIAGPMFASMFGTAAAERGLLFAISNSTIGNTIGLGLMSAAKYAIPGAIAGLGLADTIATAAKGDMETAGVKTGGMMVGALVGAVAGGLPGAMAGAGIGSQLDKVVTGWKNILTGGPSLADIAADMTPHERVETTLKFIKQTGKDLNESLHGLHTSQAKVNKAKQHETRINKRLETAEAHLADARKKYPANSRPVLRAEAHVVELKHQDAQATKAVERAERLHGVARQAAITQIRMRVAAIKDDVEGQKAEVWAARQNFKANRTSADAAERYLTSLSDLKKIQLELKHATSQAGQEIGGRFKNFLEDSDSLMIRAAQHTKGLGWSMAPLLMQDMKATMQVQDAWNKNTGTVIDKTRDLGDTVQKQGRRMTGATDKLERGVEASYDHLVRAASQGIGNLEEMTNDALRQLGLNKTVTFRTAGNVPVPGTHAVGQQTGGFFVGGTGSGDKMHANLLLEPGERGFILNKNASNQLSALEEFNAAFPRHRLQQGGVFPHANYPMLSGDTDMNPKLGVALSRMASSTNTSIYVQSGGRSTAEQAGLQGGPNVAAAPGTSHHEFVNGAIAADITPGNERFGGVAGKFGMGFPLLGIGEPWHIELMNAAAASGVAPMMWKNIPRVIMKGPRGGMLTHGQGVLDRTRNAANAYGRKQAKKLSRRAGTGANVFPTGAGTLSRGQMRKLMGAHSMPDIMGWIALAESGFNPAAYNASGASGLWQIMMPLHQGIVNGNVFDPDVNADAAMSLYRDSGLSPWAASQAGWGSHQGQPFRRGGKLDGSPSFAGWFGGGGKVTARRPTLIGIGDRPGPETATITRGATAAHGIPPIHLHSNHYVDGAIADLIGEIRTVVREELGDEEKAGASYGKAGM